MADKIKLNDLSKREQLDILARCLLREATLAENKELSRQVCRVDYENKELRFGQIKNFFLCKDPERYGFGYALTKSRDYEVDHFSTMGALFNYVYRSEVKECLQDGIQFAEAIKLARNRVRDAGYRHFWEYDVTKGAWRETGPTSILTDDFRGSRTYSGHPLSAIRKRHIESIDEFKEVKQYIAETATQYMERCGASQLTINNILSYIDTLPTPEIKVKSTAKVKKATPKKDSFIVNIPPKEGYEELPSLDELEVGQEAYSKISPTGEFDGNGTPLGMLNGKYCYPDGSLYRGNKTYDEYRSVVNDLEKGLYFGSTRDIEEEEDYVAGSSKYNEEGYLLNDAGEPISEENGYSSSDVKETKKSPSQMTFEDFGMKL